MEKPKTENLTAWITGRNLNIYQKADAVIEYNKLLEYVSDLENQSTSQKETIERLVKLLNMSKCPNSSCDNNGTMGYQTSNGDWEPEPCQWCYEKGELLKEAEH